MVIYALYYGQITLIFKNVIYLYYKYKLVNSIVVYTLYYCQVTVNFKNGLKTRQFAIDF